MGEHDALARGRAAYDRRARAGARDSLRLATEADEPDVADLERLAIASYLTSRSHVAVEGFERLHDALVDDRRPAEAARWAVWLALLLFLGGEPARAGGWLARAERLLAQAAVDCPAQGYVLVPVALQALGSGDAQRSHELFVRVAEVAGRFSDPDLAALSMIGQGRALVAQGEPGRGVAMLDEAMVVVTTGDASPIVTGIVYCACIFTCREVFDLRRAQEWTAALSRWCSEQQDLRPYRGQCLVHRAEIMQLHGDWSAAMAEVEQACAHLSRSPGDPVLGMARYQQAELLRLRGQYARAELAYRQASESGHSPHPGLALLRLAQGRSADALGAIRREVQDSAGDRITRLRVLAAEVEILLAAGDLLGAGAAVDELEELAADHHSVFLEATATAARGSVLLAAGSAPQACAVLRRAWRVWQELDAPYDQARVRLLLAQACREVGDHDTADLEVDVARRVFEQLGAAPALARARELSGRPASARPGGLTPREVEVLRLVATGATNSELADDLVLSEKTVARHLSNIYTKLGVTSRAAATAWAYEHELA